MGCTELGHSHPWLTSGTHSSYNHVRSDATFAPAPRPSQHGSMRGSCAAMCARSTARPELTKRPTTWMLRQCGSCPSHVESRSTCSHSTRKGQSAKDKKKAKDNKKAKTMPKEEGGGDEDEEIGPEESVAEKGAISVGSSWAQHPL